MLTVRPWKEVGPGGDGLWYSAWSADGCNASGYNASGDPIPPKSSRGGPCPAGGSLELLSSKSLHGPWKQLGPMFVTNRSAGRPIHGEFVTSNYFGALAGDPDGGTTRVVTQNNGGSTFWVGKQQNGGNCEHQLRAVQSNRVCLPGLPLPAWSACLVCLPAYLPAYLPACLPGLVITHTTVIPIG